MRNKNAPSAIVVGGGPAGLTAAVTLSAAGIATVLVGKKPARADNRTTALMAGSMIALKTLGVWGLCEAQAAPFKFLRIVDDTGRLWRAPEVIVGVKVAAQFAGVRVGDVISLGFGNNRVIAGLATAAKSINPAIRVIGVNPTASPSAYLSKRDGYPYETYENEPTLVGGTPTGALHRRQNQCPSIRCRRS